MLFDKEGRFCEPFYEAIELMPASGQHQLNTRFSVADRAAYWLSCIHIQGVKDGAPLETLAAQGMQVNGFGEIGV